eukprot:COSAG01_NODE_3560_length_5928_cov_6.668209_4_plen_283_part_00
MSGPVISPRTRKRSSNGGGAGTSDGLRGSAWRRCSSRWRSCRCVAAAISDDRARPPPAALAPPQELAGQRFWCVMDGFSRVLSRPCAVDMQTECWSLQAANGELQSQLSASAAEAALSAVTGGVSIQQELAEAKASVSEGRPAELTRCSTDTITPPRVAQLKRPAAPAVLPQARHWQREYEAQVELAKGHTSEAAEAARERARLQEMQAEHETILARVRADSEAKLRELDEAAAAVSPFLPCIGSPCIRHYMHGVPIGGGRSCRISSDDAGRSAAGRVSASE